MQRNQDKAVAVCVQYFLRTLMTLEREKYGWSVKDASLKAKWPVETWRQLEQHATPIEPHHWINICAMMDLNDDRLARRLNDFVLKNPVLLVAETETGQLEIYEKAVTSPRVIRNQNIFTLNMSSVRSSLFDTLSLYSPDGDALIDLAETRDYYRSRSDAPPKSSFKRQNTGERKERRRARMARMVSEKIGDKKLDALESALNLIQNNNADEVDRAVEIMAIVLK